MHRLGPFAPVSPSQSPHGLVKRSLTLYTTLESLGYTKINRMKEKNSLVAQTMHIASFGLVRSNAAFSEPDLCSNTHTVAT